MNSLYNKHSSLSESDTVRSEDFWHSVWKLIEGGPRDDAPPAKREASPQPPRDYVLDSGRRKENGRT
jgi:hypothetical protein